ncbi:hypothetical protein Pan216_04160 [Planctomycetes bacterium Pan216]|uniref:Uncharacterized protein n=1 Tax=Kolteria novifilia TaxID=2527975 RepID=A0A518AXX8_9BACT|nr:hypothetical protein Pan216_04160 [Planctomycetes bacterium Pan216]
MTSTRRPRRRGTKRQAHIHKPSGVLYDRVRSVGPEHFGIVAVDCAKARSKWMLTDFNGQVLLEPREVAHTRGDLAAAASLLRDPRVQRRLGDLLVAIERTGDYHLPVLRAFRNEGFETRLLTAVENGGAGGVSRRLKIAALIHVLLRFGKMGALVPIVPEFARRRRSANRHGVVDGSTPAGADRRVE